MILEREGEIKREREIERGKERERERDLVGRRTRCNLLKLFLVFFSFNFLRGNERRGHGVGRRVEEARRRGGMEEGVYNGVGFGTEQSIDLAFEENVLVAY